MPGRCAIFTRPNMKYKVEEHGPHCLECGDPIPYGRSDRKYCSDRCRNRYHNREHRKWQRRYARVIDILMQNHFILNRMLGMGVEAVSKSELAQLGYNFDFVTSCRKVGRRMECHCFDIRYYDTDNRLIKLMRDQFPWDSEE